MPAPPLTPQRASIEPELTAPAGVSPTAVTTLLQIAAVAVNLRPTVTSVGAVLPDAHLSGWVGSTLVAIPAAALAIGSFLTARLHARWSARTLTTVPLIVLATALVLRTTAGPASLLAGTAVAAMAVAVLGVILPTIVRDAPDDGRNAATTSYTIALGTGAAAGSLITPIVTHSTSWQFAAASWALLPAAALIAVTTTHKRGSASTPPPRPRCPTRLPWRSPRAWCTAVYFGALVGITITIMSWLPTILREAQVPPTRPATLFTLSMLLGAPAALLLSRLANQVWRTAALAMTTLIAMTGLFGLLIASGTAPSIWAALPGFGLGVFAHNFIAILNHAVEAHADAAGFSVMTQGTGYLLAVLITLAAGHLHSLTALWDWPIAFLMLLMTILGLAGVRVTGIQHPTGGSQSALPANPMPQGAQ